MRLHLATSRVSPSRSAHSSNAGVGPRQRISSTSSKSGASVRSVASVLNSSASSRLSPSTSAGKSSIAPCRLMQTRRADGADARDARIAVGRVADEREIVGDAMPARRRTFRARRRRRESSCRAGRPARRGRRARTARDPCRASRCETFSTRVVCGGEMRGRRERVVGLELDHRPDRDAHRGERFLERMELRRAAPARCPSPVL